MKKLSALLLLSMLLIFTGCSTNTKKETSDKPKVVVTTTFINDMVKEIAKDKVAVHSIIGVGVDPHLFEAKASDLEQLQNADLVLYSGLHLEAKIATTLEKLNSDKKRSVAVTKNLAPNEVLQLEEDNETVVDPHFWFDVDLYKKAVNVVSEELQNYDKANAVFYKQNTESYLKQLDELKAYAKNKIGEISKESRYLITPHDAFQYFSRANDIEVKALQGVSTDSEIATKDVIELADFIFTHKVKAIFVESTTAHKNIEAVQNAVKDKGFTVGLGKELFSDSLSDEAHGAETYIKMYKYNVDVMVEALK